MTQVRREFTGNARFDIQRRLGAGGMGVVYAARDRQSGDVVALKTLHGFDANALLRLKAEFRALTGFHHTNLVSLGELFEEDGLWFFTMELLDGVPLDRWIKGQMDAVLSEASDDMDTVVGVDLESVARRLNLSDEADDDDDGRLGDPQRTEAGFNEKRLREAFRELAQGLHFLHGQGKLHRDLKPSNVMVTWSGRVVILDFGLVHDTRSDSSGGGLPDSFAGTPGYMAPEQAEGTGSIAASDWYSVGITLFEALTDQLPFSGNLLQILYSQQKRDAPAPSTLVRGVPEDLERLCLALLDRDPQRRPSGEEVVLALGGDTVSSASFHGDDGGVSDALLVGREDELALIQEHFARSREGAPAIVLISGLSGVGKSALVSHFLATAESQAGALVLRGRCYERESVPFKTLDSLVDGLILHLRGLEAGELRQLLPEQIDALARLFPALWSIPALARLRRANAADDDPQLIRQRAAAALKELLGRLARRASLILFIDDLQWGDTDGAVLLTELLSPPNAPGLLLVASYRRGEVAQEPVLEAFHRAARAEVIDEPHELEVQDLSTDNATDLAVALLGRSDVLTRALAQQIAEESHGSPFFVRELVHYVNHQETLNLQAGGDTTLDLNVSLERLLELRLDELEPEARCLLEIVVVAGRPLLQGLVLSAAGAIRRTGGPLDALRARSLVRTQGARNDKLVETWHDRIRAAVSCQIEPDLLRSHHGALARVLEASDVQDPQWLATHFEGAGDVEKAADLFIEAARHADKALAFERAARLYVRALSLMQSLGRVPSMEILEAAGDACLQGGLYVDAASHFGRCLDAATEPLHRSDLLRKAAEVEVRRGKTREAAEMLEEVLRTVGFRVPGGKASVSARLVWNMLRAAAGLLLPRSSARLARQQEGLETSRLIARVCNRLAETFYWIDFNRSVCYQWMALNVARGIGPGDELTVACAQLGYAFSSYGLYGLSARLLNHARTLGEQAGSPLERAWIEGMQGMSLACSGDIPGYIEAIDRAEELLQRSFEPMRARAIWIIHAEAFLLSGRLEEARLLGLETWQVADQLADNRGRGWALTIMGTAASRLGQAEAQGMLREAIAWSEKGSDLQNQVVTCARLSHVLAMEGQLEEALTLGWRAASQTHMRRLRHTTSVAYGSFLAAAALCRLGDVSLDQEAERLVAQTLKRGKAYARCMVCTAPHYHAGLGAWQLAMGKRGQALASFSAATQLAERYGLDGELHDVHAIGHRAFPDGDSERDAHGRALTRLRERFVATGAGQETANHVG